MNRRRFIQQLGSAVAAFTILPSATTYARRWVRTENLFVPNPEYVNAKYRIHFLYSLEADPFWSMDEPGGVWRQVKPSST